MSAFLILSARLCLFCSCLSDWDGGRAASKKKPAARKKKVIHDEDEEEEEAYEQPTEEDEEEKRPAKKARSAPPKPAAAAVRMTAAAKPAASPSKKRPRAGATLSLTSTPSSNPFAAAAAASSSRKAVAPASDLIDLSQLDEPAPASSRPASSRARPAAAAAAAPADADMMDEDLQEVSDAHTGHARWWSDPFAGRQSSCRMRLCSCCAAGFGQLGRVAQDGSAWQEVKTRATQRSFSPPPAPAPSTPLRMPRLSSRDSLSFTDLSIAYIV